MNLQLKLECEEHMPHRSRSMDKFYPKDRKDRYNQYANYTDDDPEKRRSSKKQSDYRRQHHDQSSLEQWQ